MEKFDIKKRKYDLDYVLDHFGLEMPKVCSYLSKWIDVSVPNDYKLPLLLEKKRERLEVQGSLWNEEELKMHFISSLFDYADLEDPKRILLFYERPLSARVKDTDVSVICDALLASPLGLSTPKKPYFFLQEFKKGKKSQEDAEGQMLIAMLIAQELNNDDRPVYGCYLQGKFWNFTTLSHKYYCCSKTFDASQIDDLILIVHILKNLKTVIFS